MGALREFDIPPNTSYKYQKLAQVLGSYKNANPLLTRRE